MAKVKAFEDLVAWQKGRKLAVAVYQATRRGPLEKDFGLSGQMQRAAVSIPSNVAEGFERGTRPEFHRFLSNAKGSCGELRTQLYIASDIGCLADHDFTQLLSQATEVSRIIGGLRAAVRKHRDAAQKKP